VHGPDCSGTPEVEQIALTQKKRDIFPSDQLNSGTVSLVIFMQSHTLIHERVEAARRGENPMAICRVRSGWVVLGDQQFLPGYSLLLPDPVVASLNDLPAQERSQFLLDMALVGDALLRLTQTIRINYGIYGNLEPALHAHVFPRYASEPDEHRLRPVWLYPREQREAVPFDPIRDRPLMTAIHRDLQAAGGCT
jgi:diadenosine tetraphosphate (Ap4A) HIT family hydrolase